MALGISVVTTCYDERMNLQRLIPEIRAALAGTPHGIIVVDDSSPEGTIQVAIQLADIAVTLIRRVQAPVFRHGVSKQLVNLKRPAVHKTVKRFKGRSSHILRKEFPELLKLPSLWAHSYFVSTAGHVSTKTIQEYIQRQSKR